MSRPLYVRPSQPTRRTRKSIDLALKMKIIKMYENGCKLIAICRELQLASSTVKTILNDRERIKNHVKDTSSLKSTIISKKRAGPLSEMEKLLVLWIEDLSNKNEPPTFPMIQEKARSLFEELKVKYGDTNARFVASNGWYHRFKNRANILKLSGEVANEILKITTSFPGDLIKIIEDSGYTPQQIYNVSEAELFWKRVPYNRYIIKAEKQVEFNDNFALILGGNIKGDHKLKTFLVFPSESLSDLNKSQISNLPVHFQSNSENRIKEVHFEYWFLNCFVPEVETYCKESCIPIKVLLIVSTAPTHSPRLNDFHPNIKVVFLPPNTNTFLQPMNQGIISNFKAFYLKRTLRQAVEITDNSKTLKEFWECYDINHAVLNTVRAWEDVSHDCMNATWKKLCPQFVNKESDVVDISENVMNDIVSLAKQLQIVVDATDVEEFLHDYSEEMSNKTLVEAANVKTGDNKNEHSIKKSQFTLDEMDAAFREISSAMARFENMDANSTRFTKVQKGLERTLSCYRNIYEQLKKSSGSSSCNAVKVKKLEPSCPQPSTSSNALDTLVVSVDPDDFMYDSHSDSSD